MGEENNNEEQKFKLEVDGQEREFTPAEMQAHVKESMRADQREADLTAREARLASTAEKAGMMEQWERMIQSDPDQAVQQLYGAIGREVPAAPGAAEEEMFGEDDESLSPAVKQMMRAMQGELRDLKARDQTRAEQHAQESAGRELEAIADRFPQFEGEGRETFKSMVAIMSASAPSAPVAEIAEKANQAITNLVQSQTQRAKDERDAREKQRQMPPGSGAPPMTPPAEPFTHKQMKGGAIRDALANQLKQHGFK